MNAFFCGKMNEMKEMNDVGVEKKSACFILSTVFGSFACFCMTENTLTAVLATALKHLPINRDCI